MSETHDPRKAPGRFYRQGMTLVELPVGRPPRPLPPPIDDSPENIARAILNTPPKKADEWRYLQDEADD